MKKIIAGTLAAVLFASQASAYSPFDIVLRNSADLAVSDIYQDIASKDLFLKICNVGGDMNESGILALGIMKQNGPTVSTIVNGVTFSAGSCRDFAVGKASAWNIIGNETANFAGAVKIAKTKKESNLANNKMVKRISVTSVNTTTPGNTTWTPWNPTPNYPSYGYPDFTVRNIRFERSVSAYRDSIQTTVYDAFAADICNTGNSINFSKSFQTSMSINGKTEYTSFQPYYSSNSSWNGGDCKTVAIEASKFGLWNTNAWYNVRVEANTGYDRYNELDTNNNAIQSSISMSSWGGGNNTSNASVRVLSPNGGERYSVLNTNSITVRGEITRYDRNIESVDVEVYRRNGSNNWNETLYTTERITGPWTSGWNTTFQIEKNLSITNWPEDDYRIKLISRDSSGYTTSDWSDSTFRVENSGKPDLVVRSIYQQDYENRIVAQICNEWAAMAQTVNFKNDFSTSANSRIATKFASLRLEKNQCTTDISVLPEDLGITSGGYYTVTVRADTENTIDDRDRSNNVKSVSTQLKSGNGSGVDLAVESIWQESFSRNITAHICNRWSDMNSTEWISFEWRNINNTQRYTQTQSMRLSGGQCIDMSVSPWSIGVNLESSYTIQVFADSDNRLSETNRSNNTLSQNIYLRY